jgi:hypothetical protein
MLLNLIKGMLMREQLISITRVVYGFRSLVTEPLVRT